jgi:cathepsin H
MFKKIAASTLAGFAAADINVDFADYLNGVKPLDNATVKQMWNQFDTEFSSPALGLHSYEVRYATFQENLQSIIEHNKDPSHTWKKGISGYTDMTEKEFDDHFHLSLSQKSTGDPQSCSATDKRMSVAVPNGMAPRPDSWDWREHNGVSPVKNQGQCGSCWTFSTVGTLEAHSLIQFGSFTPLSEQQLVDCAGAFDNYGCNGGLPSHAFEYILNAGGISTEDAYPYFAQTRDCTVDASTFALEVTGGSVNITVNDEEALADAVYHHGPVSIAFQVVAGFKDYTSGVYTSDVCKNGAQDVNHAVVAVGYGTENGTDYWLVKNSWGAAWGDQGYFKIARGVNMCGVGQCNSFPQGIQKSSSSKFL